MYGDIFHSTENHGGTSGITAPDIPAMEKAARSVHRSLALAENIIRPGLRTVEIERAIHAHLEKSGVDPGIIVRVSPEEVVWHGVPGERCLKSGEIVSVDVACSLRGWWTDAARTFAVGEVDEERRRLLQATLLGVRALIPTMIDGAHGRDALGIIDGIRREFRVSLVVEGAGHGIGRLLHEIPIIRYSGERHSPLQSGRVYTVEPIFSLGSGEIARAPDGATSTADGRASAHFELSVLVNQNRPSILGEPAWLG